VISKGPRFRHQGRDEEGCAQTDAGQREEGRGTAEMIGDQAGRDRTQRRAAADCKPDDPKSSSIVAAIARDICHDQWGQDAKGGRTQSVEQLDQDHQVRVDDAGKQHPTDRQNTKAEE